MANPITNLISFFFTPTSPGRIDSVTIDAILSESIAHVAKVTDEPTEDGENINDNVITIPYVVSITGIITDTPYNEPFNLLQQNLNGGSRAKNQYEILLKLFNDKQTFSVVSGFDIYIDVVFSKFTPKLDSQSGRGFDFDAEFKHIVKVSPQTIKIPAANTRTDLPGNRDQTQSTKNKGTQQGINKDDLHQRSIAAALLDTFKGSLKYDQLGKVIV